MMGITGFTTAPHAEAGFLDMLREQLPHGTTWLTDDAYWDKQTGLVISKDVFMEEQHFKLDYDPISLQVFELHDKSHEEAKWYQIGWRCLAASLSDLAAMGVYEGRVQVLIGLILPKTRSIPMHHMSALYDGFQALMQVVHEQNPAIECFIVGGDTVGTQGHLLGISVTVLTHQSSQWVPAQRHHVHEGHTLWLAGHHGLSGFGLKALLAPWQVEFLKPEVKDAWRACLAHHLFPVPRFDAARTLAQVLQPSGLTLHHVAMMDTSDGVADACWQLLQHSQRYKTQQEVLHTLDPIHSHRTQAEYWMMTLYPLKKWASDALCQVGEALSWSIQESLLFGGEDFGLLASVPEGIELPEPWYAIGRVLEGQAIPGVPKGGVWLDQDKGGALWIDPAQCFDHWREPPTSLDTPT
ncbi:MAG: thiamine-phosphate kinase [Vampirovibrionales bacterium]